MKILFCSEERSSTGDAHGVKQKSSEAAAVGAAKGAYTFKEAESKD